MKNTATAHIKLNAIRHNLNVAKQLAPRSKILAMVKADAYGHGLLPVAEALTQADGLSVARLDEALTLRQHGIKQRLVVLGTVVSEEDLTLCSQQHLDLVVHNLETAEAVTRNKLATPINVWLKIDTGMHRLGVLPDNYIDIYTQLEQSDNVAEIIVMTHFSCADELIDAATAEQLSCFNELTAQQTVIKSAANSAALIRYQHAHFDWVRPGIMLYGADPLQEGSCLPLQAAMTLKSHVIAIRDLEEEETVGYGRTWQAEAPTRLATVGIGYGDGYPRHAKNGTPVVINNRIATLAGRVSMDLITVDITDCGEVNIGDEVILWNEQLKATEVARHADTIAYELFTSITQRVEKTYS
jgi:alanine racemase